MSFDPGVTRAFVPSGRLRAAINLGNPILAGTDPATGQAVGVSVDLAREFGRRLGVEVDLQVVDTARQSVDAVTEGRADIGFFAIDPLRGQGISFAAPYVLIEGCYLVRGDAALRANEEVDRSGHRVVIGQGSAYDLFLSREVKHATLVRAASSQAVVDTFLQQGAEVAAGVKQQLEADARRVGGDLRLLPGRFMVIEQAMGTAKGRGDAAAAALRAYVESVKAEGFVAESLRRHRVDGAAVAPAATVAT